MKIGVHLLKLWPKNKVAFFGTRCIFGWAAVTLGIVPHSSMFYFCLCFDCIRCVLPVIIKVLSVYTTWRNFFGCRVLCAKVVGATSSEGFQLIVNWHNGSTSILIHVLSLSWFITEWTNQSRLRRPIKGRREHRVLARQVRDLFSVHWSEIWNQ